MEVQGCTMGGRRCQRLRSARRLVPLRHPTGYSLTIMRANGVNKAGLSRYSGEFLDAGLESRFRSSMQAQHVRQLRIALLVTAGLFLMMGLFDYLLL